MTALADAPDDPDALHDLGKAHTQDGDHAAAARLIERAIELDSGDDPLKHNNLGTVFRRLGKLTESEASYRRALRIAPDYAYAHYHLWLTLLLRGKYREGWEEHEWRSRPDQLRIAKRFPAAALWEGEDLHGRTIVLLAEEGYGDTIQFVRYASFVASKGGRVVLACPSPLARLLASVEGVQAVVTRGSQLPKFDLHCPLMSLPRLHGTTLESIPTKGRYITPAPKKVLDWKKRIGGAGLKVGVVWAGNPGQSNDMNRSLSAFHLPDLVYASGPRFFSLQVGARTSDLARVFNRDVVDLAPFLTDFSETAAAIANLDLVIAVDTSTAHLAAALGKPVWVLLSYVPDWRWLTEGDCSPWYPTMRLYRQETMGAWQPVLDQVRADLMALWQRHQLSSPSD